MRRCRRRVGPHLRGDAEIGAEESAAQFGHEFLAGVSLVTVAHPTEIPCQARVVLRPVDEFLPKPLRTLPPSSWAWRKVNHRGAL